MQFSELQNEKKEQALKAGLARFLKHRIDESAETQCFGDVTDEVGQVLYQAAHQADPAGAVFKSPKGWSGYARAILANGEKQSNRKWTEYSSDVEAVAGSIADFLERKFA